MGNRESKTYPMGDEPPAYDHDYGYDRNYDQHRDYDTNWEHGKHYGEAYYPAAGEDVIQKKRSCTDVLCLALFIAFLCGWGTVAFYGLYNGDISKVIYPTDSEGNVCGQGTLDNRPYLLIFDMTQCLNPAVLVEGCLTPKACVSECPHESDSPLFNTTIGKPDAEIKEKMKNFCKRDIFNGDLKDHSVKKLIQDGICPPWYLKSDPILGYCLPLTMHTEDKTEKNAIKLRTNIGVNGAVETTTVPVPKLTDEEVQAAKDEINENLERGLHRFGTFLAVRQFGERVFSDLKATYWMVGVALIGACIFSFVWILLMRYLAGAMVYTSILTVFLGVGSLLGYCSFNLYHVWQSTDPETNKNIFQLNWTPEIVDDFLKQRDTWLAFTSVVGIIFLVVVCLFIFLWQRIRIAIALIEQGSRAVGQSISSLFFPLLPFLFQLVVVAWFLIVYAYLSSWSPAEHRIAFNDRSIDEVNDAANNAESTEPGEWMQKPLPDHCKAACEFTFSNGTIRVNKEGDSCVPKEFNQTCGPACPEISCQFVKYGQNKDYVWMQMINIFGLYWGLFFFSAFGELVLAGVFAEWYWSNDNDKSYMPSCVLGSALWNATIYHLGTVAFGSLILAIIRTIKTILEYIEKKCKKFNNDLTKCLLKCCQCCLWCLEKFMRFINRNAYIMCAVKSTSFCKSARDAFNLLMRNLVRVVVLDSVVDFLLFLGKIVIVLLTGAVSYLAFAGYMPDIKDQIPSLNYIYTPVVFIVIGSYVIASSFFGVYNMAVDTLFLCFLEDLERNDGSEQRPYKMSKSLQKILGKMNRIASDSRRH